MRINYTTKNPSCYNANNGSITINSIELTPEERQKYGARYTVIWSDNIQLDQIHSDFFIIRLPADKYSCQIFGNGNYSNWQNIELINPENLSISNIKVDNNPCDQTASITLDVFGGLPPYIVTFNNKTFISNEHNIKITDINHPQSARIKITDSNNCCVESDIVSILFSDSNFYEIEKIDPPLIYDDHPKNIIISLDKETGPYQFEIYTANNNSKENLVKILTFDDISLGTITNNRIIYNLAPILYPGSYILDITNKYNCIYSTPVINIPNALPLKVNIKYNNNNTMTYAHIVPTEAFFDTILIPYHLLINNNNIIEWIRSLETKSEITFSIGNKKYIQKIIKYNKNYNNYSNHIFDILQLGSSSDDWFFSINIARGFTKNDDIFVDNIKIKIDEDEYLVTPGLDNDTTSFKLIIGNLITANHNTNQFETTNKISLYDQQQNNIGTVKYDHKYYLYNTYQPGSVFVVNLLESADITTLIDIKNPEDYKFNFTTIDKNHSIKHILQTINSYSDIIYMAAINSIVYNGGLSLLTYGGHTIDNNYKISYHKYDIDNKQILALYKNHQPIHINFLTKLEPGTYVIRITDEVGNKIRFINNEPYDNHYIAAMGYIHNILQAEQSNLQFAYGDILINVLDSYQVNTLSESLDNPNLPGISKSSDQDTFSTLQNNSFQKLKLDIINVANTEPLYDNSLKIMVPQNIQCHIIGPKDFKYTFNDNIQFINLYPGVYTIYGDSVDLEQQYLLNSINKIYIGNKNQEYLNIIFKSYYDQIISK